MVAVITHLPIIDAGLVQVVDAWLANLTPHYNADELRLLATACNIAQINLSPQQILIGETQLRHNLATADILAQLHLDVETLQVALLQGALGSNSTPESKQLEQTLSRPVVQMVASMASLSLLGELPVLNEGTSKERQAQAEGLRRLLLGMVDDVRAILVLLAGRLHLLRTAKNLSDTIRRQLAVETQRLYAPLANRLGIWQIKWELEDMSLRFLEPEEYKRIAGLLDGCRVDREVYINQVLAIIKSRLNEVGIQGIITGRPKHIYSIWRKMSRKKVNFDQIFDVRAVRILVNSIADCYAALGVVHGLWPHIAKEFDDYIATPKANLYQSIHTAVVGPDNKPVEIQIRTHDMHKHAELGVAAHWRYKENSGQDAELEHLILRMRRWLERKTEGNDSDNSVADLQGGFEAKQIYVLTPKNRVITLPKGSTALDFAYAIHSEVGHACRGARVGGRLIPLTQPLQSGQTVEIITTKQGLPSRDWLNPHLGYLHTNSARNRVRHWFKQQDFEQHLTLGRSLLDKELAHLEGDKPPSLDSLAQHFNYKKADDLLAAIGRGDVSPIQVLNQIKPKLAPEQLPEPPHITQHPVHRDSSRNSTVMVEGVSDLMTQMAGCCKPVPYDSLIGFITQGRGVTVHRDNCPNILQLPIAQRGRLIQVRWGNQPASEFYLVDVLVVASDRKGLLRDLSAVITAEDVDVLGVNSVSHRSTDTATFRFSIEIANMKQLERILSHLTKLPEVMEARRCL